MSAPQSVGEATAVETPVEVALAGRLEEVSPERLARLLERGRAGDPAVAQAVATIVADVRARGDAALRDLARRFDGVALGPLEVPRERLEAALASLPPAVRAALAQAADAIAAFHRAQLPAPVELEVLPGVRLARRYEPLARVGVYAPGGTAAYPSSVLMGVVPARVAGVEEVIVCSPPGAGGLPSPVVMAAAALAGADRVFALGGAGAVAAMAYGTATVPRVAKVVGPGNAYVDEAKRQLAGVVSIDGPAGPSDVLVVADATAPAELVAAELLAQAEHDGDAAAVLVTTDPTLPGRVLALLARWLPEQPRQQVARASLAANGGLLVAATLEEALAFAARYAPEHLALLVADPRAAAGRVRGAGTVCLGAASSVAFGDYASGANHVLPTGGRAAAFSGLSTLDFLRSYTTQELTAEAAAVLAGPVAVLAEAEGLPGHALAVRLRGGGSARANGEAALAAAPATARQVQLPAPRPRACLSEVPLYDPGRTPIAVDLSDNTNRWGVAPAAARALAAAREELVTRYPSPYSTALVRALARAAGVEPEHVVTGCGSDDVLDSTLRAFCSPGDRVACAVPAFGMVPIFARASDGRPVAVPLRPDLSLDEEGLAAARAAVTYLCRPNNPTGTLVPRAAVERLAARLPGLLVVDEAYIDFADEAERAGLAAWAAASRNVVVLRTLSKAYGLAGLRLGYAVGPPAIVAAVARARGPYKVGGLAEAAALAVLTADGEWVRERVRLAVAAREALTAALRERRLEVLPSAANFLFVRSPGGDLDPLAVAARLRERGVAVRAFADLPVVGGGLRVTVAPAPQLERFLDALAAAGLEPTRGREA